MTLSVLELHCLNALCDDYESVITARDDVRRSTFGNVTDDEVGRCMVGLARKGFIDAFEFDSAAGTYLKLDRSLEDWRDKWFLISPRGRIELDANWVDTRP